MLKMTSVRLGAVSDHHHHHHHDHSGPLAIGATAARVVVGVLVAVGVIVLGAMIWLWPSNQHVDIPLPMQNAGGGAMVTESGTVTMQDIGACGSASNGKVFADQPTLPPTDAYTCQRSVVAIESGPDEGGSTLLELAPGPGQPDLHAGDHIRLVRQADPSGTTIYSFDDYSRGMPLLILTLIFVVVIAAVARWRGLRAVLGLVFAFGVLVVFLLPALLDGKPAIPVAMVAGSLILYAVLYLAHGVNLRTSSALLGTLTSMVLAAVLSWVALEVTHVTGLSEEQNTNVATYLDHVSITGLLLAGFIIGSLGVLNDVTITQAAAAFELAALDEDATRREIFAATMRVGRDHIASTVYTLVLAYAGGALPLLLMFSVAGRSITDVLTGDAVAIEITRSVVGGICLALSVPLTTAIAVMLARPFSRRAEIEPEPPRRTKTAAARREPATAGARRRTPARAENAGVGRASERNGTPEGAADDEQPNGPGNGPRTGGERMRPRDGQRTRPRDGQGTQPGDRQRTRPTTGSQPRIPDRADTGERRRVDRRNAGTTGGQRRIEDTGSQRRMPGRPPESTGAQRRLPPRPEAGRPNGNWPTRAPGTETNPGMRPRPRPTSGTSWPTKGYDE